MASSVEVRVPYLDHVLVQQLFSLPTERLLGAGRTKIMLRDISERSMPTWNHCEPKLYVATPQREWVKSNLQTSILEMINTSVLARGGYVDANRLSDQYADYCRDVELGNSFFVWKFVALELWYREFIN
jgi:asparagine synthase (glutamine-hydrolysing)